MDHAINLIVTHFLGQGVHGIVTLCLGYTVYRLYNRNQELHETLYDVGRESSKSAEATTASLNRLTDLLLNRRFDILLSQKDGEA